MVMWTFKSCPRCGGDLFAERDQYGWYQQCLQCSFKVPGLQAGQASFVTTHLEEPKEGYEFRELLKVPRG